MSAALLKLTVAKGEDVTFSGVHRVGQADATPVDISGWTILIVITNRDGSPFLDAPGTVTDGPNGAYAWPLTHTQTDVPAEIKLVDIWRDDNGALRLMAKGTLDLYADNRFGS